MNSCWVILVQYKDKPYQSNVSQDAYATYEQAKAFILTRQNIKQISDYDFVNEDEDIVYTLKTVMIKEVL